MDRQYLRSSILSGSDHYDLAWSAGVRLCVPDPVHPSIHVPCIRRCPSRSQKSRIPSPRYFLRSLCHRFSLPLDRRRFGRYRSACQLSLRASSQGVWSLFHCVFPVSLVYSGENDFLIVRAKAPSTPLSPPWHSSWGNRCDHNQSVDSADQQNVGVQWARPLLLTSSRFFLRARNHSPQPHEYQTRGAQRYRLPDCCWSCWWSVRGDSRDTPYVDRRTEARPPIWDSGDRSPRNRAGIPAIEGPDSRFTRSISVS